MERIKFCHYHATWIEWEKHLATCEMCHGLGPSPNCNHGQVAYEEMKIAERDALQQKFEEYIYCEMCE